MNSPFVFLMILLINLIIVVVYMLFNLVRKRDLSRSFIIRSLVMLMIPIAGPLIFLAAWLYYHLFFRKPVDLEDVVFSKERVKTYLKANEEEERNIVPMEEALAVTDKINTRRMVMEVIKKDISNSLATISLGLNSDDSEVSHYSASVLQEALDQFRSNIMKQYDFIQILKESEYINIDEKNTLIMQESREMFESLNSICLQHAFSSIEQENYVLRMEEMAENLYQLQALRLDEMEQMALRLLEVKKYDDCKKWLQIMKQYGPNTLPTYSVALKLYYTTYDRDNFFQTMRDLKQSGIAIDQETLQMIRVFE